MEWSSRGSSLRVITREDRTGRLNGRPSIEGAVPDAWTSVAWQAAEMRVQPGDLRPSRIDGLTVGQGLLVSSGRMDAPGRNQFNDMGGVFVSTDGVSWRAIPLDDGVGPQDTSEVQEVAIGPLGLLAYGDVCCSLGVPSQVEAGGPSGMALLDRRIVAVDQTHAADGKSRVAVWIGAGQ